MSDDDSWSAEITRRRVLGGILTVGGASSAAGAGTMALFSDTESSTGNSVQAGTLDLAVNGDSSNTVFRVDDAKPGVSDSRSTTIKNEGTLPGYLTFGIAGFQTPENGVNEPESGSNGENDPRGSDTGGDHTGELGQRLHLKMKLVDDNDEEHYLIGSGNEYERASTLRLGEYDLSDAAGAKDLRLDSEEEIEFETEYHIPGNVGNEIQSDSVVIDLAFALTQERGQRIVPEVREPDAETIGPDNDAGVRFDVTNDFGSPVTINALHVQPKNKTLSLLSDMEGGSGYQNGNYDFGADVYVDADTDGWVDGGSEEFRVPGWIDMSDDGHSDGADQEPTLSPGSTASVSLYAFRGMDDDPVDMGGEQLRVTLDVTLDDDGTETFVPLKMIPIASTD